jgi:hypothetical protein
MIPTIQYDAASSLQIETELKESEELLHNALSLPNSEEKAAVNPELVNEKINSSSSSAKEAEAGPNIAIKGTSLTSKMAPITQEIFKSNLQQNLALSSYISPQINTLPSTSEIEMNERRVEDESTTAPESGAVEIVVQRVSNSVCTDLYRAFHDEETPDFKDLFTTRKGCSHLTSFIWALGLIAGGATILYMHAQGQFSSSSADFYIKITGGVMVALGIWGVFGTPFAAWRAYTFPMTLLGY